MKLFILLSLLFVFQNAFGKTIDLSQIKEISSHPKKKVFIFISATCPCSQKSLAHLEELSKKYKDYDFYGVNETSQMPGFEAQIFFKNKGIDFSILQDRQFKIADAFKAVKTPHAFILNEKNEVLFEGGVTNLTDISRADELYLLNALVESSENKIITKPQARALGCYIKRD